MKKARLSNIFTPANIEAATAAVSSDVKRDLQTKSPQTTSFDAQINAADATSTQTPIVSLPTVEPPVFTLETPVVKMKNAKPTSKKRESNEETPVVKIYGRPPKLVGDLERANFNTMVRKEYIVKIKQLAFEQGVSNADIIDDIFSSYFS